MEHHFNIEIAKDHGVNVAVFLNNMGFWIQKNIANNKHFYDGRYWTYNSVRAYALLFPYFTPKQIRTIIEYCVKNKLLLKGNYNDNKHDRTSWYSLSDNMLEALKILICPDGQTPLPIQANRVVKVGKCINETDRNTDRKTDRGKVSENSASSGGKPERFSLSDFENKNFDFEETDLNKLDEHKLNSKKVFDKFKSYLESKSKKTFTQNDLKLWISREIEYKENRRSKNNTELHSVVPDFVKDKDNTKYCTKDTAISYLNNIRKTLRCTR